MRSIIATSCVLMVLGCLIWSINAQYYDGYGGQGAYGGFEQDGGYNAQAFGGGAWFSRAGTFISKGLQGAVEGLGNQAGQAAGEALFRGHENQNNQG